MILSQPQTKEEFSKYFFKRWEILRKPLDYPEGSEIDESENVSLHVMASEDGEIVGVGRLTYFESGEGQIRFMGVDEKYRNRQIGKKMLEYLEGEAKKMGLKQIKLNARENALQFYEGCGYKSDGPPFKGFAGIPHTKMIKKL